MRYTKCQLPDEKLLIPSEKQDEPREGKCLQRFSQRACKNILLILALLFLFTLITFLLGPYCGRAVHAIFKGVVRPWSVPKGLAEGEPQIPSYDDFRTFWKKSPGKWMTADACWEVEDRFDCYPADGASQEGCEARGCCWRPPDKAKTAEDFPKLIPDNSTRNGKFGRLAVPMCFYPIGATSYRVIDTHNTTNGLFALIQRRITAFSVYPSPVELLLLKITFDTPDRVRIVLTDSQKERYQVPFPKLPDAPEMQKEKLNYEVKLQEDPFALQVVRKSSGLVLFDTSAGAFSFYDQFIEISSFLPSNFIYGLGEHSDRLSHSTQYTRFTFFATDSQPGVNIPLYGSHPFYLSVEENGDSSGVLLFNSNAMDVILTPAPAITYRTIGGLLDFSLFLGPSPNQVIAQYIQFVGTPALPPYWALGFHLCKYGYGSLNRTKEVMQRNIDAGIPLDVQWNDIDYMDKSRDFTFDPNKFDGISRFVHSLHERGMHYVIITDPGISSVEDAGTYSPYDDGVALDCFLKNASGGILEGKVWTGERTVFPDFTHPNATAYWTKQVVDFHGQVGFDGLWIDMNEPSNFGDGSEDGCPASSLEDPPYLPHVRGASLKTNTVCMTAKHYLGLHYNLHSLYGLSEAMATHSALLTARPNRRPFIISRSTFVGQGRVSGHWSGDYPSTWEALQWSIPNMLNFNMYGIPLVGSDICGFNGNTTEELCRRWQQVGAFYPFSRNHNSLGNIDQDPAAFSEATIDSTRNALLVRYSLLPVYYTLFFKAALNGSTVVRPLLFEFPKDRNTWRLDWQFMVGESLMVSPVLEANVTQIEAYFPDAKWYDFYTGIELDIESEPWVRLPAPADKINLHIRGGAILPTQKPETTTLATRKNPFRLTVTLDRHHQADGELFWDDGEQFDVLERGNYTHVKFHLMKRGVLKSFVKKADFKDVPKLKEVRVLGTGNPHSVLVNGKKWPFSYAKENKTLSLDSLALDLLEQFMIVFVY